ncbi:MAG: efflux RND transporter permease subunit, partial [Methylothermaceae bacterium]|nr:efflux RND transporter permease subunit [Methylothermaceae bacterium]
MNLIAWFTKNPVAANMLMGLLIVGGIVSLVTIDKQVAPAVALDRIEIRMAYPGAGPNDVERTLCIPIEETTRDLEGIRSLASRAREGQCEVTVEVAEGRDSGRLLAAIKRRLDNIETFPEESRPPQLREVYGGQASAISLSLLGEVDGATLRRLGLAVRDSLLRLPEVSRVKGPFGVPPYEIAIEVSAENLRRYGLAFDDIVRAVRRFSVDLPGGELKTRRGTLLLRSPSRATSAEAFESIVLRSDGDGGRLTLGEVATVHDGVAREEFVAEGLGHPMVRLVVYPKHQALETSKAVLRHVEALRPTLPPGIELIPWDDYAKYFEQRAEVMADSVLGGFCLIAGILLLFLGPGLALWAGLGIVISFLGAFALLPLLGFSLNAYTIFAFVLVLGIVVDDTIVIGEHIHSRQRQGLPGLAGALEATRELAP